MKNYSTQPTKRRSRTAERDWKVTSRQSDGGVVTSFEFPFRGSYRLMISYIDWFKLWHRPTQVINNRLRFSELSHRENLKNSPRTTRWTVLSREICPVNWSRIVSIEETNRSRSLKLANCVGFADTFDGYSKCFIWTCFLLDFIFFFPPFFFFTSSSSSCFIFYKNICWIHFLVQISC